MEPKALFVFLCRRGGAPGAGALAGEDDACYCEGHAQAGGGGDLLAQEYYGSPHGDDGYEVDVDACPHGAQEFDGDAPCGEACC